MAIKKTSDALKILRSRYVDGNPEAEMELENARQKLRLSTQLHELREQEGLTQNEVAKRAGTTRSVIARLEQPGYEKHTVSTLHRVAKALGYSVKVEFVPLKSEERVKARTTKRDARPKVLKPSSVSRKKAARA